MSRFKDRLYLWLGGAAVSLATLTGSAKVEENTLDNKVELNQVDEDYKKDELKLDIPYYVKTPEGIKYVDDRFEEKDGVVVFTPKNDYQLGCGINDRLFGWTNLNVRVMDSKGNYVPLVVINPRVIGDENVKTRFHEIDHHNEGGRMEARVRWRTYTEQDWKPDAVMSFY